MRMADRYQHILAPLDGSTLAETILPVVRTFAGNLGARVTLLHVIEHDAPGTVHGERHIQSVDEAETYLAEVAEREFGAGSLVDWHAHPNPESDVARSIREHASDLGVDLVALATHGTGGLRGFFLGSIAQQVLRRGNLPVLLARPGGAPIRSKRIAVPLDDVNEAEVALPVALMLGTALQAELLLVSVVPTRGALQGDSIAPATFLPSATAETLSLAAEERQEQLDGIRAELNRIIPTRALVLRGDAATEITRAVRETDCELVIMPTHARAGIEAFIAGSVASSVVSQLHRPILLLRQHEEG